MRLRLKCREVEPPIETDQMPCDTRSSATLVESSDISPKEQPWQRMRIHVPREDASVLAIPALSSVPRVITENSKALNGTGIHIAGRDLVSLRADTFRQTVLSAGEFMASLTGRETEIAGFGRIVASGHQPELFHPGVWIKNFAVSQLAARTDSIGLNLIVDSDTIGSCRIRVPAGTRQRPFFETLEFDAPCGIRPWEDSKVLDGTRFETFADRVTDALGAFGECDSSIRPLVSSVWSHAVRHASVTGSLSESLSLVRILLERNLGSGNLELPVSRLCRLEPFFWFAADILLRAAEFREIHNQTLSKFRKVNRIRSRTHPVSELTESAGWIEVPFRIWRAGQTQRRAVFVRISNGRMQCSTQCAESDVFLDVDAKMDCETLALALEKVADDGFRFRTRALTTTLFMRLCLADLFVHGIGGARYDEMTNRILTRFYGIHPPDFLTLSATAFLPLASPFGEMPADVACLTARLRDLQQNPQRYLSAEQTAAASALVKEKQHLIEQQNAAQTDSGTEGQNTDRGGKNRYRRFPQINRALASFTETLQNSVRREILEIEQRIDANTVLKCREFSFCLYPVERIETMLTQLQHQFDTG